MDSGDDESIGDEMLYAALEELSFRLSASFERDPRLVRAIGDWGAFATVVVMLAIGFRGDGSATLAGVQAIIVPRRIATSRRIRNIVDWLEHSGAVERSQDVADARRRPCRAGGWLLEGFQAVAQAWLCAAAPCLDLRDVEHWRARPDALLHMLVLEVFALIRDGAAAAGPVVFYFSDRVAGYLVMLEMMRRTARDEAGVLLTRVSRKGLARSYGVSRAHVTAILARAEAAGWLQRLACGAIRLSEECYGAFLQTFRGQLNLAAGMLSRTPAGRI